MFLIKMEAKDEAEKRDSEFKWSIFANDPKLYYEMFEKEREEMEEGLDYIVPQSKEEVDELMDMIRKATS